MKPLIYYDFKEISDGEVSISKKRLEEIFEEVYQAGYTDGANNKSWITTTPWISNDVVYRTEQSQSREITSGTPIQKPNITITCKNSSAD